MPSNASLAKDLDKRFKQYAPEKNRDKIGHVLEVFKEKKEHRLSHSGEFGDGVVVAKHFRESGSGKSRSKIRHLPFEIRGWKKLRE